MIKKNYEFIKKSQVTYQNMAYKIILEGCKIGWSFI